VPQFSPQSLGNAGRLSGAVATDSEMMIAVDASRPAWRAVEQYRYINDAVECDVDQGLQPAFDR
jgi:hypothetical protein